MTFFSRILNIIFKCFGRFPVKNNLIPDTDHILRHVPWKYVEKDDATGKEVILGGAFLASEKDENSPSYNWLEVFSGTTEKQVAEVIARKRRKYHKNGKDRLARLNVGHVRKYIASEYIDHRNIEIIHDPLKATDKHVEDTSHALMRYIPTLPDKDSAEVETMGDLIAHCVIDIFHALEPST